MSFLRRAGHTAFLQLVSTTLMAANMVILARTLGAESTGVVTFITGSGALLIIICSFGSGSGLRLMQVEQHFLELGGYWRASIGVLGLTAIVGALVLSLGLRRGDEIPATTIALGMAYVAALSAGRQSSDAVNAFGRTDMGALGLVLGAGVQLASQLCIELSVGLTLHTALTCIVFGPILQSAFYLVYLKRMKVSLSGASSHATPAQLIRVGIPPYVSDVGATATQRLDKMVALPLIGASGAGAYAVAATCAEASRVFTAVAAQMTFLHASSDAHAPSLRRIQWGAAGIQGALAATVVVFGDDIFPLVFGDDFAAVTRLVLVLLGAEILMTIYMIGLASMAGRGIGRPVIALGLGAAALACVAYPLGASWLGASGLAASKAVTYAAASAVVAAVLHRLRRTPAPASITHVDSLRRDV